MEWRAAAAIATIWGSPLTSSGFGAPLALQVQTVPSVFRSREKPSPAATLCTPVTPGTWVGAPRPVLPHIHTVPSAFSSTP
jgi:hypothetical protein